MSSSYCSLRLHLVWSTKDRKALIDSSFESALYEYIGGILRKRNHVLLSAGGTPDHIHLLVAQHPTVAISDLVRDVKSNSSAWVHDEVTDGKGFEWQTGYGAFSVSSSNESKVDEYIHNQKEHRKVRSFKSEFVILLKRHKIEYDERYIWE